MVENFVFNTAGNALRSAMRPTAYEQDNDITCLDVEIIHSSEDFKIAELKKSDNTKTLVLVIKKAKQKNLWINWIPTERQFQDLLELKDVILSVERRNKQTRL